ncbi:hypothetical protein PRUPE_2G057300 [Prunus persica]|uniref:SGNH hydrolase-type esterase domain-containing protein n=2 Tax=Prunus persica TaxID=3760 RepID=A0A251QBQ7_PRUPE|nr:hypothetical protein PRUPE_2G057300 [Prunus persica]
MRPKIYLLGDSITKESFGDGGWGASLAHLFSRTVDVGLRGYSGYKFWTGSFRAVKEKDTHWKFLKEKDHSEKQGHSQRDHSEKARALRKRSNSKPTDRKKK